MNRITLLLLSLVAAACGKVSGLADANGSGSGIDAHVGPDAPPPTVKVTVYGPYGDRTAAAGIPVAFINPDGSVAAHLSTNIDGKAEAVMQPGGSVTAVWLPNTGQYLMETVLGAKPGDDIAIVGLGFDNTPAGSYNVSWTANPNATYYYAYTGCGAAYSQTTSVQIALTKSCQRDPMTVAVAAMGGSGQIVGYIERPNVPFVDGGTTNLTGIGWASPLTFQATITNIDPAVIGQMSITRYNDDNMGFGAGSGSATSGTTLSLMAPAPSSAGKALVQLFARKGSSIQDFYQPIAGNSFAYNFDVGTHLLPWVGQPTLDVAAGTITVPLTGTGEPDAAMVSVGYSRTVGTATTSYNWIVLGPNFDQAITLPKLPVELGDVNPKATDTANLFNGFASMAESDAITSYDQVRNDLIGVVGLATSGRSTATLVRVSSLQQLK